MSKPPLQPRNLLLSFRRTFFSAAFTNRFSIRSNSYVPAVFPICRKARRKRNLVHKTIRNRKLAPPSPVGTIGRHRRACVLSAVVLSNASILLAVGWASCPPVTSKAEIERRFAIDRFLAVVRFFYRVFHHGITTEKKNGKEQEKVKSGKWKVRNGRLFRKFATATARSNRLLERPQWRLVNPPVRR